MNLRLIGSAILTLAISAVACGDSGAGEGSAIEKDSKITASGVGNAERQGPFELEQGMVEMNMDMAGMPAKMTLYFNEHGKRQATFVSMEMMGQKMESVTLLEGGYATSWESSSKVGTRMKSNGVNAGPMELIAALTDERKKGLNYKEIDSREILGHPASGFSIDSAGARMKVWHWKGIPLLIEMEAQGRNFKIEATRLDTDTEVPAERLSVPADVTISEGTTTGATRAPELRTGGGSDGTDSADNKSGASR